METSKIISKKTIVIYEATALVSHTDSYGNHVVKKGEKCIIKKPNLDVYRETGKAYFRKRVWGSDVHYLIPVKLVKVTQTKLVTEEITEEREEIV